MHAFAEFSTVEQCCRMEFKVVVCHSFAVKRPDRTSALAQVKKTAARVLCIFTLPTTLVAPCTNASKLPLASSHCADTPWQLLFLGFLGWLTQAACNLASFKRTDPGPAQAKAKQEHKKTDTLDLKSFSA